MPDYGTIHIGLSYPAKSIDDFSVNAFHRFEVRPSITRGIGPKEIEKIRSDHEQIGRLLNEKPDEMREILDDILAGRHDSAKKKARRIGLTEENIQQKGGGALWLIVVVVAVILLYPRDAK